MDERRQLQRVRDMTRSIHAENRTTPIHPELRARLRHSAVQHPGSQRQLAERSTMPGDASPVQDVEIAIGASMRVLREKHSSVAAFAASLASRLGRAGLSRQAVYDWEQCRSRVPTVVWIVAAELAGMTPDEALAAGWNRAPIRRPTSS